MYCALTFQLLSCTVSVLAGLLGIYLDMERDLKVMTRSCRSLLLIMTIPRVF
jgi:hypothetical protein